MSGSADVIEVVFQPTDNQPRPEESVRTDSPHRQPFAHNPPQDGSPEETAAQSALASRYRYYSRLDPSDRSSLRMPNHVVPANFFSVIPFPDNSKQSSIVTIFSIWNTMVGTSLLSLPWAMAQAGLLLGGILVGLMGVVAFYTAFRVVRSSQRSGLVDNKGTVEFSDICRFYFGPWGERTALLFSLITLVGACVVYWVLMSNFLYNTVNLVYETVTVANSMEPMENISLTCDVLCFNSSKGFAQNTTADSFHRVWQLQKSVPLFLVLIVFPLLNFKSPTFFTKFNGLGTISVLYLLVFALVKASECGIHMDFRHSDSISFAPLAEPRFAALTGILSLSYFIHNCILSILQNQKYPENNVRDLSVSYVLVGSTYFIMGVAFYVAFPLHKWCINQNFLDNFSSGDLFSSVARVFLLFQMTTVFPLLLFLVRVQLFGWLLGSGYPSLLHVMSLNSVVLAICVIFACVFPQVGTIIGFVGSLSGLVWVFALPCLVYLAESKAEGSLTVWKIIVHGGIVALGLVNFIGQFLLLH